MSSLILFMTSTSHDPITCPFVRWRPDFSPFIYSLIFEKISFLIKFGLATRFVKCVRIGERFLSQLTSHDMLARTVRGASRESPKMAAAAILFFSLVACVRASFVFLFLFLFFSFGRDFRRHHCRLLYIRRVYRCVCVSRESGYFPLLIEKFAGHLINYSPVVISTGFLALVEIRTAHSLELLLYFLSRNEWVT